MSDAADPAAEGPGPRGRPRQPRTDEVIREAALALLREQGPGAVNVAAVAARTGVARTTIYRRYRDRAELLAAVLHPVTAAGAPPEPGSVRDHLAWVLRRTGEVLASGVGPGGVAAVLTGSDPEFATALRASLESGLAPVRELVEADIAAGDLRADLDPDLLLDLVLGAYLAGSLRRGAPDAQWVDRTAAQLAALVTA
ncbi:TetR/AcrR family transcriptional regulator [Nocardioides massiliensis]|uniref:AcrR family transcriptional regulator n=1 Tax=Nocardioides massiliensis TaxID=1325935 RepID=A0ABT9NPL5_9ACTN|nr:TetR/AcrR family transcriptional regulator [Nocardioides massiliensis]MDP9822303.1 AcrR family transcriptional regulator [Nocardioides massiliensis]